MNATWKDFLRQAASPESMPQSRTSFDRISGRIGASARTAAKRFLAELPFGTMIPAVARQAESDNQARLNEWYSKLTPERQKRFHDVFLGPGLWSPSALARARTVEFNDMPGGAAERMRDQIISSALMPGRIKAYRPMLSKLPGNASGATVKAIRKRGLGPKHDVGAVQGLVRDDLREIRDRLGHDIDSASMADSVFAKRNIVKDLNVLGELDPGLKKMVVNNLRSAEPISGYRRYVHEENNPFRTELIPDKEKTLLRYNQLVSDRVRNSLAYQRMNRRIASRIPIDMKDGKVSAFSIFKIKQWLKSEAMRDRFRGIKHRRAEDLAERTRIYVDPNGRDSAATSTDYAIRPRITLSVSKDNKGGFYVNKDALRHEFGHVLDIHGTEDAGSFMRMLRRASPMGTINGEIRANRIGGLPKITPWTDTYYATSRDPKLVLDAWKRYRHIKKPNLPQ